MRDMCYKEIAVQSDVKTEATMSEYSIRILQMQYGTVIMEMERKNGLVHRGQFIQVDMS